MKKNILLLLISASISLLVLEGGVRVYLFGWDSLIPHVMESIQDIGVSGKIQASKVREIVYELKPNLNGYFKKTRLLTNPQGLRDKSYEIKKRPGLSGLQSLAIRLRWG